MRKSDEILHAARLLHAHYGEDGAVIAVMRAAEAAALGDEALSDYWESVAEAIEATGPLGPHALN